MRKLYPNFVGGFGALALVLVRLVMGLAFVLHGWPKIQNPMGWMNAMGGSSVPSFLQALAALAEFGGGIGLILGFLTPIAAFGLVCQMIGALVLVHLPQGHPFVSQSGPSYELPLVYLVVAIILIALGPGRWSIDALMFGRPDLKMAAG
ncbi:MAG TPA: DoxX family protein [Pyrinomonadaceae bacterium]|nr:DoxX family protein [Pyrinomonadaceae bacterium]